MKHYRKHNDPLEFDIYCDALGETGLLIPLKKHTLQQKSESRDQIQAVWFYHKRRRTASFFDSRPSYNYRPFRRKFERRIKFVSSYSRQGFPYPKDIPKKLDLDNVHQVR